MIYTKNPDGTKHVTLVGSDGKPIEMPQSSDGSSTPPNRCLYEAVAKAQNCSVDQLLDNVKTHATTNRQAQYLYAEKLDEALPNLRVGRACQGRNAEIFFLEGEQGDVRHVVATITKENIKGGTDVTNANRKDLKDHKPEDAEGTVHAGHLVAFVLGGKGGKKVHNVVNMAAALNQGPYKVAELKLVDYLIENPNAKVYLHIELNAGVEGFVDLRNPLNFRDKWFGVNGDTTTTYDSGVLTNTNNMYVENAYNRNQQSYQTYNTGENQRPIPLPFSVLTVSGNRVSKIEILNEPPQNVDSEPIPSTEYNPV
jgi:hypothetical protein